MKGTVVKGYMLGDLAATGTTGAFFHAIHPHSRQRAIARVVSREHPAETERFIEEASSLLEPTGAPELIRGTLHDGRVVLLVVNGSPRDWHRRSSTARLPPVSVFAGIAGYWWVLLGLGLTAAAALFTAMRGQ